MADVKAEYVLRQVSLDHLEVLSKLETESYPPGVAATAETLHYRATVAPEFFQIFTHADSTLDVVGFVVGTAASPGTLHLHPETMSSHDPRGDVLCVHSVVVHNDLRGRGIGSRMLQQYVHHVTQLHRFTHILLLALERHIKFYERSGFTLVGRSDVEHGTDPWFELEMDIRK